MGLDFTAVDFETANGFRGSPCSVGLVRIRDGVEVASAYLEMRPPRGFDRFDPKNIGIHGITPESVSAAPRFSTLVQRVFDFIGSDPLVAHNASFDVEVLCSALEVSRLPSPGAKCYCSVRLSRAVYDLPSHALPKAAAEAGYLLTNHHHALDDARASAAVVSDIARRRSAGSLDELYSRLGIEAVALPAWQDRPVQESRATRQARAMGHLFDSRVPGVDPSAMPDLLRWQEEGQNLPPAPDADPAHPLYGQQIVFTGSLGLPRPEAKRQASVHGAATTSRVTSGTTMVVVGDAFVPADLEDPERCPPLQTRKAREARRRRTEGQPIQFLSEAEFLQMLPENWPMLAR